MADAEWEKAIVHEPPLPDPKRAEAEPPVPSVPTVDYAGPAERSTPSGGDGTGRVSAAWPVFDGYEILEELGHGGMGVVYKARQTRLRRLVALKMTLAGSQARPEQNARFRLEAEAAGRLQHPHIVQIFEIGEKDGQLFYSMELVEGETLAKYLGKRPRSPSEVAPLVETLARAVHHAHQQGIIHRDLKPANVLLTADGTPKITDFGLAKRFGDAEETGDALTRTGDVVGTPAYAAPEQLGQAGAVVGPATDVFALGTILYEMLTGRPPFRAATIAQTMFQVLHEEPVPPARLQPGLPADLDTIALKCLQKAPGRRYASALDLAEDLRRFRAGEPIQARPVGRLERAGKWVRRKPALAALIAVTFLAALALVGTGLAFMARLSKANNDLMDEVRRKEEAEGQANELAGKESQARQEAEADLARAENAFHAAQVQNALRAWEQHDVAEAERILGAMPGPFQQTWEVRHLRGLCRRKAQPLRVGKW
jgi:tRNA A-37 threonylcarbamoyl transferase component Bud32